MHDPLAMNPSNPMRFAVPLMETELFLFSSLHKMTTQGPEDHPIWNNGQGLGDDSEIEIFPDIDGRLRESVRTIKHQHSVWKHNQFHSMPLQVYEAPIIAQAMSLRTLCTCISGVVVRFHFSTDHGSLQWVSSLRGEMPSACCFCTKCPCLIGDFCRSLCALALASRWWAFTIAQCFT